VNIGVPHFRENNFRILANIACANMRKKRNISADYLKTNVEFSYKKTYQQLVKKGPFYVKIFY
jgi:hypothetical protein